jgi:hypothetical protein
MDGVLADNTSLVYEVQGTAPSLSQIDGRYQNEISVLMEEEVRRSTTYDDPGSDRESRRRRLPHLRL